MEREKKERERKERERVEKERMERESKESSRERELLSASSELKVVPPVPRAMEVVPSSPDDERPSTSFEVHDASAVTAPMEIVAPMLGPCPPSTPSASHLSPDQPETMHTQSLPTGTLQSPTVWKVNALRDADRLLNELVALYVQIGCEICDQNEVPLNGLLALINRWQPLREISFLKSVSDAVKSHRTFGYAERSLVKLKSHFQCLEDFRTVLANWKSSPSVDNLKKASSVFCKLILSFFTLSYLESMEKPLNASELMESEES